MFISLGSSVLNLLQCSPNLLDSPGFYKWNTDASVREQVASGGGVLRDSTGKVIFAFYKEFGEIEVLSAEASALLFGLQLCVDGGFRQVQVVGSFGEAGFESEPF